MGAKFKKITKEHFTKINYDIGSLEVHANWERGTKLKAFDINGELLVGDIPELIRVLKYIKKEYNSGH